jgi:SAM-dependent methyltransferase/uncharacterized protein YbaR (Trm112 family)
MMPRMAETASASRLADVLHCVRCGSARLAVRPEPEAEPGRRATAALFCDTCGAVYPFREGVLHLSDPGGDAVVDAERQGSIDTEHDASMGGISGEFDDLAHATGDLREALLALPSGTASGTTSGTAVGGGGARYYAEPGYFANVRRCARGFDFVVNHLDLRDDLRLLDIGADLTWSTAWLARRGLRCTAIDINHHLPVGRLYQDAFGITYDLVNVDAHAPAFRDAAFYRVTAFHALHHSGHITALAANLARALAPGGLLGLCEPFCTTEAQRQAFGQALIEIGVNEHVYTLDEWHGAFSAAGLRLRALLLTESFNAIYEKPAEATAETAAAAGASSLFARFYDGRLDLPQGALVIARAGETLEVPVLVTNRGIGTWCSESEIPIRLSYHVSRLDTGPGDRDNAVVDGVATAGAGATASPRAIARTLVAYDNPRTPLPGDIAPARPVLMTLVIACPAAPGRYLIDIDLVQERITWFADRGFTGAR